MVSLKDMTPGMLISSSLIITKPPNTVFIHFVIHNTEIHTASCQHVPRSLFMVAPGNGHLW